MKACSDASHAGHPIEPFRCGDSKSPAGGAAFGNGLGYGSKALSIPTAARTFLVVDDNAGFLQIVCEMLHSLGHRTHAAQSGEQAIGLIAQERFDILLSDINLPGMSGIDLARATIKATPGIRIIFSSGFGYLLPDGLDFDYDLLHKPYFINQLRQAIG
jgi:CheY-like chemotaxis protein